MQAHGSSYNLEHALTLLGEKEKGIKEFTENDEGKDAKVAYLTDNPLMPPDLESFCMEGFEDIQRQNSQKELFTRERGNLLKTIGVLTQLLVKAQKGQKLGSCEKPNFSQIAAEILQYLSDNDLSSSGRSDRSLRERIKNAIGFLKTNK